MQQHPVPQPITSYEFRLVGDMTLKQFGKLAGGVILALIVYGINPPGFIKWPLIFLFAGAGAATAFLPFGGRSIDVWVVAFLKRIYSPTLYLWQAKNKNQNHGLQNQTPTLQKEPEIEPQAVNKPIEPIIRSRPILPYIPAPPPNSAANRRPKVEPRFLTNMILPTTPTMPNIIVGYVHTPEKKIIDGAIIEICDSQGIPVRALKTNQLGQFQTATPLPNGIYEIELEKEGYFFDIIKVNFEGKTIPPIEIISK